MRTAVLLVDVINSCSFEGGEALARNAQATVEPIVELCRRARAADVPVIYANDNYGRWTDTFAEIVERCREDDCPGRDIARALAPQDGDHFILKPKHSAFYLTSLDALLRQLGTERLVICGYAGDLCVLFTANAAHMREYEIAVPEDAIASEESEVNDAVLRMLRDRLSADTRPAAEVEFR